MRLVHLSDLHLGYRQMRLTPGGINQREADVAATFRTAIDRIIELAPDVVNVAGDIFHTVRPTNQAILHGFIQFARLAEALPNTDVLLLAGNHDTPRSSETGGILQLFTQHGLHVVDREPKRLKFGGRMSVSPFRASRPRAPGATPDPDAEFNVLVMHGPIEGMPSESVMPADRPTNEILRSEIGASRWDYVALGEYHVYAEVEPNVFYSGSIDYTSANLWLKLYEANKSGVRDKGFIERDLATGAHTFHALPPSRLVIDLPAISARGLTVAEIDEKIRTAVESVRGGIEDRIIRLMIRDLPRHIGRELDHKAIRDYKRRALNFHLDLRRPDTLRLHAAGSPGRRLSLNEIVREKLMARPLDADVDRAVLVERAMTYLDEAQLVAQAPPMLLDV
jgi:hypothetical protein